MTDSILARESVEVLYEGIPEARMARQSIENLTTAPSPDPRIARVSVEVLISPIINVESWGFIPVV